MGCDIHVCTEVKTTVNNKKVWRTADRFRVDPYSNKYEIDDIYDTRNYPLFSALAGVRSYSSDIPQLSDHRGLPDDCCEQTRKRSDEWGCDGHSHSYCTLQELYDYQDACKIFYRTGMVSPEDAKNLDENSVAPSKWCQGTSDETWVSRTWAVDRDIMKELVQKLEDRARYEHFVYDSTGRVSRDVAENTRIVFWFDN